MISDDSFNEDPCDSLAARVTDTTLLNTYSLVLAAASITHRIQYVSPDCIELYVQNRHLEKALYEIAAFDTENRDWPPPPHSDSFAPTFRGMSAVVIGGLIFLYSITGQWHDKSLWFENGAGNSTLILENLEFFRLITALTLHADIVHLLGNCFLGAILLHFFLHLTGNGLGLAAILFTATNANLINVLVHGPGHLFVGFSTAIFSIIGMLCTISFILQTKRPTLHFLMPIMSGLALLAFLGSSGERTDLGAHLFGLLCGLIAGNFVRLPHFKKLRSSFLVQSILATLTLATVFACWLFAM